MADVCFQFGPFFRQYGAATASGGANPNIQVGIPTSTNANLYTSTFAAGDVKVAKDGGAEANITALPTQIGATGIWVFTLTGTEATAAALTIHVKKAASTAEVVITVETRLALGTLNVNATGVGSNTDAVLLTGVGTGNGLTGVAGGSGKITNLFDTSEVTEPGVPPPNPATYGQHLQYLYRRFFNLVTQTVSTQTLYKADSVTPLTSASVSDDGVTQAKARNV